MHQFSINDKQIIVLGTAHVSIESAELVTKVISEEKPDTVCVELCQSRYDSITQKEAWQNTDIRKVIKEKRAFLLLSNLLLASFQKRIGKKLGIKPGEEMINAIKSANDVGAKIFPVDRDIRITLSRIWRIMGFWSKCKLLFQLLLSIGEVDNINQEDIEKMKQEDMLQSILSDVGRSLPVIKEILIDERDKYLAQKIKSTPGEKIIAVVGAGHVPGIKTHINSEIDLSALEQLPPKSYLSSIIKWTIPLGILILFVTGFYFGGVEKGTNMVWWWFIANGFFAGIGAVAALAHPVTILSSVLAAPITSLNPMIAAGWVSGLVEAFSRKPKVKDFEKLSNDILSIKGFWSNNVTRILLVVVFTNIGSSLGTMAALTIMLNVLK